MENGLSLYQITGKFYELFDKADNEELTEEEAQQELEELTSMLQNKSQGLIGYARNLEGTIEAIKKEKERFATMQKYFENKLSNYKEYIKSNMDVLGIDKIETPIGKMAISKNPLSVEVFDIEKIPEEFKKTKVEVVADKAAIGKHFKETGEMFDGVKYVNDKTSLRIK